MSRLWISHGKASVGSSDLTATSKLKNTDARVAGRRLSALFGVNENNAKAINRAKRKLKLDFPVGADCAGHRCR